MAQSTIEPIYEDPNDDGRIIELSEEPDDGGEPRIPEALVGEADVQPELEPDGGQEEVVPDGTAPEDYLWRWRDQEHRVPRQHVTDFGKSIGAPSDEAVLNWTQIGRDVEYHKAEARRDLLARQQELDEYEAALRQRESELTNYRTNVGRQASGTRPRPAGYPTQPGSREAYAPGGYGPTPRPAPTTPSGGRYPAELERMLTLPDQFVQFQGQVLQEIRADREERQQIILQEELRENGNKILREANEYLEDLKKDGFIVPEDMDAHTLIRDSNRYGLSANPNIPWREAFETVASRRLYRSGFKVGQARLAADLNGNRGAGFRPPRLPGVTTPPAALPGNQDGRQAARDLGRAVSMREAAGG